MSSLEASPAKQHGSLRHVPELDGVRGIAVAGVMAVHFIGVLDTANFWEHLVNRLSSYGVWGVDLFFVLSGFLITGILDDARGQSRYFANFYARRSLRIFPLYYGVLILLAILPWLGAIQAVPELAEIQEHQVWLWTYTVNFYLPTTGGFSIPYVSHFWSLAIEEQFYLLWPWLVGFLARRQAMRAAVALTVVALGLRLALPLLGYNKYYAVLLTPCRLDALCVGAWFAMAIRDEHWAPRVASASRTLAISALAAVVGLSVWLVTLEAGDPIGEALRGTVLAIFFGSAITLTASREGPRLLKRGLRVGWLRWLGKYSYGLYVYHGILGWHFHHIGVFESFSTALGSRWAGLLASAALGTALSIAISVASYEFYEAYFLKLKRHFGYGRSASKDARPATLSSRA